MKTLFLAVATGQNVANLPPIIEEGERGDAVLWVISPVAEKNGWADGALAVLCDRGFEIPTPVPVRDVNAPRELMHGIQRSLPRILPDFDRLAVITNGGQKLTPIGLQAVANRRNIEHVIFLYGQTKPCELWRIDPDTWQVENRPYSRTLSLSEMLRCSGREIFNPDEARCFWRLGEGVISQPETKWVYPKSSEEINQLHRIHEAYNRRCRFELFAPSYDEIEAIFGKAAVQTWGHAVEHFLTRPLMGSPKPLYIATRSLLGCERFAPTWEAEFANEFQANLENIFNRARKGATAEPALPVDELFPDIYRFMRNRIAAMASRRIASSLGKRPPMPLGPSFETAVESRVATWLERTRGAEGNICEAWANLKVKRAGHFLVDAEFDILLALANGILIHLECKSFTVEQKDLDARLTTLHVSSSNLAEMVVVGPIYAQFAGEAWFQHAERLRGRLDDLKRIRFLPFTLPGQPDAYERINADGTIAKVEVPHFETSLNGLIAPYVRNSAAAT